MKVSNKVYISFFIIVLFWTICLFSIFATSLSETILDVRPASRIRLLAGIPEGWAFFTRDPKESFLLIYKKKGDKWVLDGAPTGSAKYYFGIDRSRRLASQEMGTILPFIPGIGWAEIEGDLFAPANSLKIDSLPAHEIVDKSRYPFYSGEYLLQEIKPVPYPWFKTNPGIVMNSKINKIKIINK